MKVTNIVLLLLLIAGWNQLAQAQNQIEEIPISLSNPSEPGKLVVQMHQGRLTVEGYSGNQVIVTMVLRKGKDNSWKDKNKSNDNKANGLRKIPNHRRDFQATEYNNVVKLVADHKSEADLLIKVPKKFSLQLNTHHDGDVLVKNVSGEIEVDAHHGEIELQNVGGSVVADTHHGDIEVILTSVQSNIPMAFSTYHGDVDITMPSGLSAVTKLKSAKGEIFTDFDMEVTTPQPKSKTSAGGPTKIVLESWIYGKIGKGGPEFMFTTHHGDIILRKGQ